MTQSRSGGQPLIEIIEVSAAGLPLTLQNTAPKRLTAITTYLMSAYAEQIVGLKLTDVSHRAELAFQ